jgi:hypothetical protein
VRLEGLGKLKKIHLIGTRTRDLPACSIVPQPNTLSRAPYIYIYISENTDVCMYRVVYVIMFDIAHSLW